MKTRILIIIALFTYSYTPIIHSFKIITDPYNKKSGPYNWKNASNKLNSYTIHGSERLKKVMNLWSY